MIETVIIALLLVLALQLLVWGDYFAHGRK